MTTLATTEPPTVTVPAPARTRPPRLHGPRPWDCIAFRAPERSPSAHDDAAPHLVWPQPVVVDLPEPGAWCGALVRTCVEVLLGARPAAQLARWLTDDLYVSMSRRAGLAQALPTSARRVQVLRVHTCELPGSRHEASVVLHDGRRVRAAAVRIEVYRGRWRATALEIG